MDYSELKKEIPEIFEKVKKDVKKAQNLHRAGISLDIVEMGMSRQGFIGGIHFSPGTDIVMNKTPLKILLTTQPDKIMRAYVYHILLHEYLFSLGILDERMCRELTLKITEQAYPQKDHPARIIAKKGIAAFIPNQHLIYAHPALKPDGISIEQIDGFDSESYSYYS
ncbi:MAG: hypothetical protein ACTSYC_04235 [Promethearchaeota archaeon]